MNIKKIVSAVTAFALSASVFAGFGVTASAATAVGTTTANVYYNDFSSGETGTWDGGDDITISVAGDSNYISFVKGGNANNRAVNLAVTDPGATTISQDVCLQSPGNTVNRSSTAIAVTSAVPSNFTGTLPTDYLLLLNYSMGGTAPSGSIDMTLNGNAEETVTMPLATWVNITLSNIDYTAHTAVLNITNNSTSEKIVDSKTISISETATKAVGFYYLMGRGSGTIYADNLVMTNTVNTYAATVTLKDASGAVTDGTVTITDTLNNTYTLTHSADGAYTANVPAGTYTVTASSTAYPDEVSGSLTVDAAADDSANATEVELASAKEVALTIKDAEGVVNNAKVELVNDAEVAQEVTNNNDGTYSATVIDGTYTATITADGYFTKTVDVTVANGAITENAEVTLTKLYTVTYVVDSTKAKATGEMSVSVTQDAKPSSVPTVTDGRNTLGGYIFTGWSNGTSVVDPATTVLTSDTTYTAQFTDAIGYKSTTNTVDDNYTYTRKSSNDGKAANDVVADTEEVYLILSKNDNYGNTEATFEFDLTDVAVEDLLSAQLTYTVTNAATQSDRSFDIPIVTSTSTGVTLNTETIKSAYGTITGLGAHTIDVTGAVSTVADNKLTLKMATTGGRSVNIATSENSDVTARPYLTLYFKGTAPATTVTAVAEDATTPTFDAETNKLYAADGTQVTDEATLTSVSGKTVKTVLVKVNNGDKTPGLIIDGEAFAAPKWTPMGSGVYMAQIIYEETAPTVEVTYEGLDNVKLPVADAGADAE